ncbi:MAG TPA: cytochrome c, partial [Hyphomonadaceae bacterium]
MKLRVSTAALAAMIGLAFAAPAVAQQAPPDHPGRGVYNKACATCHDNPVDARAATLASIQQQAPARLREVLTTGVMAPMAAGLSPKEITDLISFLTYSQSTAPAQWYDAIACSADKRTVNVAAPVVSNGFGIDAKQNRMLTAKQAGLKKGDMKNLEVAWALAFPGQ